MLRDILTGTSPYIFRKHIYAVAAILGAMAYYVMKICVGSDIIASLISIVLIVSIRLFSTKFRLELPKINLKN